MKVCTRTTTTTHTQKKRGLSWTCAPSVWPEVTCGEYFGRSSIVASGWAVASTPLLNFLYCPWRTSCIQFDSFHTLFLMCDSTEAAFTPLFLSIFSCSSVHIFHTWPANWHEVIMCSPKHVWPQSRPESKQHYCWFERYWAVWKSPGLLSLPRKRECKTTAVCKWGWIM